MWAKYLSRFESYFIMMNIYGSGAVDNAKLTYKVYDASTGTIYPAVSISDEPAGTFTSDKSVGSFGTPLVFTPLNEIEQDLSKGSAGWTWFSFFAQPKQNTISDVFSHVGNSLIAISSRDASAVFTGNGWQGTLSNFDFDKMYKLNAAQAYTESLIGEPVDPTSVNIMLTTGWNWVGYPAQASNSLNAVFAGAEPQEGDMVKSQSAFSVYTEGEWVGTLTAMVPGVGYMYNSTATDSKSFNFPKPSVSGRKNMKARPLGILPLSAECNMTMVAVVMDGDELIEDAQVSVYAGTELNGRSEQAIRDGRHFLTIGGGRSAQLLTFVVTTADGREYILADRAIFAADAQMGTLQQPYVLQLSDDATNIQFAANGTAVRKALLLDGSGRLVRSSEKVCTKADLERMPAGVYYQQVVYDNGMIHVEKLMR